MYNRDLMRAAAHARLKAMGVPHSNKIFGLGLSHTKVKNLQRTARGRKLLNELRTKHEPVWRRVTMGSMKEDGKRAILGLSKRRYGVKKGA